MGARSDKIIRRERRRLRSKKMFAGPSDRSRLVVYRSIKHIYGQIVDDSKGNTLVSVSTVEKEIQNQITNAKSKVEKSEIVGRILAERAKAKKIKKIVFDRNGFLFHGRVKAFADGARSGGLDF